MNANQFLKAVSQLQGWREFTFLMASRSVPSQLRPVCGRRWAQNRCENAPIARSWLGNAAKDVSEAAIPQLLAKLESLSPDVNAYDAYGVYPAFDFCQLLEQALLNRLNPGKHRATDASQMATATVMNFVELSEGEDLEEDELVRLLDQHPLMKEDKVFQRDLILALKRQRTPTSQFVERIHGDAASDGVSNLGISLSD